MANMTEAFNHMIVEIAVDQNIEELIAKQVRGFATDGDRLEFQELVARRSRMMRPVITKRKAQAL